MHIAEVVTIAKSLPLLRLNTYKSLILSYSADYRRIFKKNTTQRCGDFCENRRLDLLFPKPAAIPLHLHDNGWCQKERPCGGKKIRAANENRNFTEVFGLYDYRILISEKLIQLRLTNVLGKWKSHTRMAQPSEKFQWKKSMACPCFLHRVFSKAVQSSMKVVVGVYINDFFLAVEYANKIVRQIKEWCFFWSVSLQPTKRSTFPHAVLLRHERVACHCFMSFGLCNKNGTASCGYKSQPLSARQTKKSPWQYSLEAFQGILSRIFLAVP